MPSSSAPRASRTDTKAVPATDDDHHVDYDRAHHNVDDPATTETTLPRSSATRTPTANTTMVPTMVDHNYIDHDHDYDHPAGKQSQLAASASW